MSYQALYRKYRPQLLKDVVGQSHITKTIQNAFLEDKLSHAYLFVGPRGTGKTSVAKLIAKTINCEQPTEDGESCGCCETCKGIAKDQIADVVELDAASNNGVDEVRDIREKVRFASQTRYKVYIIDEVHMLTTGAFNALLKTLEEPPSNVIFILATTEAHKVPVTIISRCQRFDFKRMTEPDLLKRMQYICEMEQYKASTDALMLIAKVAQGGMRDALSILDQAISYAAGRVTIQHVQEITGTASEELIQKAIIALIDANKVELIDLVEGVIEKGLSPERFCMDLTTYLRDLLLLKSGVDNLERIMDINSNKELASALSHEDLYQLISYCEEAIKNIKFAANPKIVLETMLIKSTNYLESDQQDSSFKLLQEKLEMLERMLRSTGPSSFPASPKQPEVEKTDVINETLINQMDEEEVATAWSVIKVATKEKKEMFIKSCWNAITDSLRAGHKRLFKLLHQDTSVMLCSESHVVLVSNQAHELIKSRHLVEEATFSVTNKTFKIVILSHNQWNRIKNEFLEKRNVKQ